MPWCLIFRAERYSSRRRDPRTDLFAFPYLAGNRPVQNVQEIWRFPINIKFNQIKSHLIEFSGIFDTFHTVGTRGQPTRFLLSHNRGAHASIPDILISFGSGARVCVHFSGDFFIRLSAMISCLCS